MTLSQSERVSRICSDIVKWVHLHKLQRLDIPPWRISESDLWQLSNWFSINNFIKLTSPMVFYGVQLEIIPDRPIVGSPLNMLMVRKCECLCH